MIGQIARHDKVVHSGVAGQTGLYRTMRQLIIIGLVSVVLLAIALWRYNAELTQAASIPPPVEQTSVVSPTPPPVPPTPPVPPVSQTPAPVTKTQLQVNGQTIPVPTNGTVQQTVQSPDGTSTVHFSVNSTSSGSNDSSSSTDIQVDSNSSSQVVSDDTH